MERRDEYRPLIQREFTDHEKQLWTFNIKADIPNVLAIKQPSDKSILYKHSQIDEEAEEFYSTSEGNYFAKKFKDEIEREHTWATFISVTGTVVVKPLEKRFYWNARELIKTYFLPVDPLWSWYEFEKDQDSYSEVMRFLEDVITSGQSVTAINKKEKSLHGVALGRYYDGSYISKKISQTQYFHPKMTKLMNVRRFFEKKVTSSLKFWDKSYFNIYILCTDGDQSTQQVALLQGLVEGCLGVARQLNASYAFVLSTQNAHDKAFRQSNFEEVCKFPLYSWLEDEGHMAKYVGSKDSATLTVFIKELKPIKN